MNMKTVLIIVAAIIIGFVLWSAVGNKNTVVKTAAENVKMTIEEAVLPEPGHPDDAAVIRRAMIEQRKKENNEWTASNIHAKPELYLAHCQKLLAAYVDQYSAAVIETKTSINKCGREIANAEGAKKSLTDFLAAAQKALSDAAFQYPGKVGLYTYADAGQVKNAVLKTDKKLTEYETLILEKKRNSEELKAALAALEAGKERVEKELRSLGAKMEMAKSGAIMKHVDSIRDRIDALLSGVEALPDEEIPLQTTGSGPSPQESVEEIFKRRNIK